MYKLLFVDDDKDVLALNQKYFIQQGYQVLTAEDGNQALHLMSESGADCIILDIMIPGLDGLNVCHRLREITDVPILFLTGRAEEQDRVDGLLSGADDYVIKPYSLRELAARIAIHIRRHSSSITRSSHTLSYPPLSLNLLEHKAYYMEQELVLSNREYELLQLLALHPDELVTFSDIGDALWGYYSENDRRTITVVASRLRKKMEEYPHLSQMIETVWSKGYRLHTAS